MKIITKNEVFFLNICSEKLWDLGVFVYSMWTIWGVQRPMLQSLLFFWLLARLYVDYSFFNYNMREIYSQLSGNCGHKCSPRNTVQSTHMFCAVFDLFCCWDVKHTFTREWTSESLVEFILFYLVFLIFNQNIHAVHGKKNQIIWKDHEWKIIPVLPLLSSGLFPLNNLHDFCLWCFRLFPLFEIKCKM